MESRLIEGDPHKRQETDGESEKTRTARNAVAIEDDVATDEKVILVVYSPNAHVVCVSTPNR